MFSLHNVQVSRYSEMAMDSIEIVAPIGSRTVVQLADGTIANLNYGSKIKYPRTFTGETREIILMGEGYFNVAHNPESPFIVKTKNLQVRATGTGFNVKAYPDEGFVATTLVNGKVVVEKLLDTGKIIPIEEMKPGQHINYDINTNKAYSSTGEIEKYIAWKEGKLVFKNDPLAHVATTLSRMFNVDIEITDEIKNFTFTVTFVDEPLFQILDLMSIAIPVAYQILPRKKLPDGTFSKQKIIIRKRT
jgi:ferric-dicitrate binding protein FerR (iron transport regulator)